VLDYDAIIIGGGPAGLAAGLYLSRGKYRTLLVDKEGFGGQLKNMEWIENYPGFSQGVSGPQLASEMISQATGFGLQIDFGEVNGMELYSGSRCVNLADGRTFTAEAVIVAGGCRRKKLGVPGELEFEGKGVFGCALCDGDQFTGKVVAVCGGGDTGVTEAIYMTKIASKVILLEALPQLMATPVLQDRARGSEKLEIHCGARLESIAGDTHVEAIMFETEPGRKTSLPVDGVLIDVGMEPQTAFLESIVDLDPDRRIGVDGSMATSIPYVFAAGDIRSGSPGQVVTAVSDGAIAAIHAQRALQRKS
jgi:thioredoxin reductase (NADPH)